MGFGRIGIKRGKVQRFHGVYPLDIAARALGAFASGVCCQITLWTSGNAAAASPPLLLFLITVLRCRGFWAMLYAYLQRAGPSWHLPGGQADLSLVSGPAVRAAQTHR